MFTKTMKLALLSALSMALLFSSGIPNAAEQNDSLNVSALGVISVIKVDPNQ